MWQKLKDLINNKTDIALLFPLGLAAVTFFNDLVHLLEDGKIDSSEFTTLSAGANGLETFILAVVLLLIKRL